MDCLLGRNGFIGSEIAKRLGTFETIFHEGTDRVFYFGAPSSVILFDKNIDYCLRETINSFMELANFCKENGLYLIYPSSATVYNKNNSYARCKAILEELHQAYGLKALGLRISAGYGFEEHKGDYGSVIYKWIKQMMNDEVPIIYGDGTQTRDFIFITDVVDNIMEMADKRLYGIYDIGSGINTSFNEVIDTINKVLGKNIKPIYIHKPGNYIQDTPVQGVKCKVTLEEGIKLCVKSLS